MVLTVFAVKYTYFKPQNILINPQNILMISYTYQAKFCRTTPEEGIKENKVYVCYKFRWVTKPVEQDQFPVTLENNNNAKSTQSCPRLPAAV